MKKLLIIATGISLVVVSTIFIKQELTPPTAKCVEVVVDYGVLDKGAFSSTCIVIDKKTTALSILNKTDLKISYIDFGKDLGKATCTINNLPKINCDKMDWESYWGVFEKHGTNDLNVTSKWAMSQKGISYIYLSPGDSLGLVYLNKGKVRYPNE
jgi:hypothetical protein